MAKTHQEDAAAPVEPVVEQAAFVADDAVMTIYGMTLGGILADAKTSLDAKDVTISEKDTEIARLTAELAQTKKPRSFTDAEISKAIKSEPIGLRKLPDGSVSLRVTVPEEVALPLLSQAESAGEDAQVFIQRNVEESLLAYTCS